MNRDPLTLNQPQPPALPGAFNPNPTQSSLLPSLLPSLPQLSSSSSSHPATSMSRVSSRNSPTAIAAAYRPPSTFATINPTTTAPTQAPSTSAHMTTSALPPFSTSRLSTMASSHATSLAQLADTTPAPTAAFHDSQPTATLYVRGFDANFDETSLKYMLMAFNDRLLNYGLVGQAGGSGASTTRTAYVQTKTMDTAREIQATFHNKSGLTVEFGHPSSESSRPSSDDPSPATSPAAISSPASRFDAFSPVESTSTHNGASLRNGNGHPFNDYQKHYMSQQTPIGNHLQSQPRVPGRVSGKALINDANDDDDVLRLPQEYPAENIPSFTDRGHNGHYTATNGSLSYSENGTAQMPRRATAPHLHIDERLRALSLSSNGMSGPQRGGNGGMYPQPTHANAMSPTNIPGSRGYPHHSNYPAGGPQRFPPPSCPADQNEPCNTLYVGNLPLDATEEQLRKIFTVVHGYKRMCYRTKPNGPMCFVEFEDTSTAAQAMDKMYGVPVNDSQALKKGGMRLSFSKNPLGVRGVQTGGLGSAGSMRGHQGLMGHGANGYAAAAGPPPGLHYPPPPPGLGPNGSASSYTIPPGMANGGMTNGSGQSSINSSNMSNGSTYALQGTNGHAVNGRGNSALGVGNGNGAVFDQRSGMSSPWSSQYISSTTPGPNPYAQAFALPPYTPPTNGGYNTGSMNGFGSYGRGGARQASS